jgi:hypothetical protein
MFIQALFAPDDGKLLGAQVLGWDGVDKRIDVFAVALRAGLTVLDLEHVELAYAPPYGSAKDPVSMIGFQASNLLRGDIDLWYPEDYPDCADRVTIIDTRTPAEYEAWHIPEAVLIPYDELRQRLDEVPQDRPVYAYRRSGFRSYLAYEILKQHGWGRRRVPVGRDDHLPRLPPHPAARRRRRDAGGHPRRGRARATCRRARARLTTPRPPGGDGDDEQESRPMGDVQVEPALGARSQHAEGPLWDAASARLWWVDIMGRRVHCSDPVVDQDRSWATPGQPGGSCSSPRDIRSSRRRKGSHARHVDGGDLAARADRAGAGREPGNDARAGRLYLADTALHIIDVFDLELETSHADRQPVHRTDAPEAGRVDVGADLGCRHGCRSRARARRRCRRSGPCSRTRPACRAVP